MIRLATTVLGAASLAACANLPDWVSSHPLLDGRVARTEPAQYNFDWILSGERQLAPLQVFDDGQKTWLHFLPGQIAPAIFQHTDHGERLLSYVRQGDYLILDGVWPALTFRGAALSAFARKQYTERSEPQRASAPAPEAVAAPVFEVAGVSGSEVNPVAVTGLAMTADADKNQDAHGDGERNTETAVAIDEATQLTEASFDLIAQPVYDVRLHDGNLRHTLHRWAARADWTFAPEHWDVDVDIPISGEADFEGSFQDVVQDVLASTELADRPLRPCFYSNRVLRVVAYAQPCDRSGVQAS